MKIIRGAISAECLNAIRDLVIARVFNIGLLTEPEIFRRQRGIRLSTIECDEIKSVVLYLEAMTGLKCDLTQCSARYQEPDGEHQLRWHQDAAPMKLGPDEEGIVAWVPLDPIDGTRPTLEIADPEPAHEHVTDKKRFLVIENAEFKGAPVKDLAVGDIVLMSPYEPHRTLIEPGMTQPRISMDMRFYGGTGNT